MDFDRMQNIAQNQAESAAAVAGVTASGLLSIATGGVFLSTGLPAVIGGALYATQKWKTDKSASTAITALIGAVTVGWLGGPWFVEFLPKAAAAGPIIAFASSYWGIELVTELKTVIIDAIKKKVG